MTSIFFSLLLTMMWTGGTFSKRGRSECPLALGRPRSQPEPPVSQCGIWNRRGDTTSQNITANVGTK